MIATAPVLKDLVLLGGGHAHVSVLKAFGMRPIEGVRLTLINREIDTPYSGMLPGMIAGHYSFEETHIDLGRLARFAGARFINEAVTGIEPETNRLLFDNRPPLEYTILSINTGSTPNMDAIEGAEKFTTPVKPISRFLHRWKKLCTRAMAAEGALKIAVVGAGAGGVELLLAAQYALEKIRTDAGITAPVSLELFSASAGLLPTYSENITTTFTETLTQRGVKIHTGAVVRKFSEHTVTLENGDSFHADEILLVTDAIAPKWFAQSGLDTDAGGFIKVSPTLQSLSHPKIFAAGDIAAVQGFPRPKAGVFAVRQGPALTKNLRKALLNRPLVPFRPQKEFLSLISTGDRYAVASRNGFTARGKWVWRWKDWIDRRFMDKFNRLPAMEPGKPPKYFTSLPELNTVEDDAIRCGGCGAKVGADALSSALQDLQPFHREEVVAGIKAPDDAAIIRPPQNGLMVHTVDSFRAIIDDPFLFGKIAANHALSDIYAMGGEPQTALAIAALPYSAPAITAADLRQLMAGAIEILNAAGVTLVGGHTAEAAELALGFAINGQISEQKVLRKAGLKAGDQIILTKPLGTGALFAADMQYKAKSIWISAAIQSMLQSNQPAAQCLIEHGAHAATDVTGFGLAGHLAEMAQPSHCTIEINPGSLPLLAGFKEVTTGGIFSSLHQQNVQNILGKTRADNLSALTDHPALCDPQTSGGLVAALPPEKVEACLVALTERGYNHACIIARVAEPEPDGAVLTLGN